MSKEVLSFATPGSPDGAHGLASAATPPPALIAGSRSEIVQQLTKRAIQQHTKRQQSLTFIGVAGPPGSGKSTLSSHVAKEINRFYAKPTAVIVIPMDGYHYSQAQLKEMRDGETLLRQRGSPATIDAAALVRDLHALRDAGAVPEKWPAFPVYDRNISDPVQNALHIPKDCRIVLCEGLYVLASQDEAWAPLQEIWDDTWLLEVPETLLKTRLERRHLRNWNSQKKKLWGSGRDGAIAKVEATDLPNARWVREQSNADVIVKNVS